MTTSSADLLPRVGAKVRALREARGLTQAELARRSGVSVRFLADVEGGTGNASLLRLGELALVLEVSVAELVVGAGPVVDELTRFGRLSVFERRLRLGARAAIVLVGLRGAGKSTVGAALAARLGVPFREVDRAIEEHAGVSLGELFADAGFERYRRLEREVLDGLLSDDTPQVLAAGGSLVTDEATWAAVRRRARTVWLRAGAETHLRRVEAQGDHRPMRGRRDALAELRALLAVREPLYAQADHTVDTEVLDRLETVWALDAWARDG